MKILQINATANWGSTGKIAEQLGDAIKSRGGLSYIAYSRRANESSSVLIKIGNRFTMYTHVFLSRFFDGAGLGSYFATRKLLKCIKKLNPDIIHLHNIHGYVLNYKLLFDFLNNSTIKVVWTFHDFWAFTGHCCYFESIRCREWMNECIKCPLHKDYPLSFVDYSNRNFKIKKTKYAQNKNLTVVAVSKWVADLTSISFMNSHPIEIIHNGVDISTFNLRNIHNHILLDKLSGKFVIMGVASKWDARKGINDFIKLSSRLKSDEIILLVGVEEKVALNMPPNIIAYKHAESQDELAELYNIADVVVSFSSAETFGMTIIEGMACGTPAVVYDNTAPPSIITPETGIVVPDKDVDSAYSAIQEIKSKGKINYSENCIKHIQRNYDKDKCFSQYVDLYERLLNNK